MNAKDCMDTLPTPNEAVELWLDSSLLKALLGDKAPANGPTLRNMLKDDERGLVIAKMAYVNGYANAVSHIADIARAAKAEHDAGPNVAMLDAISGSVKSH